MTIGKNAAARGEEIIKALNQATLDLEEKGSKYHDAIIKEAWTKSCEFEELVIREGRYEHAGVVDFTLGHFGPPVERATAIHSAAENALAEATKEIEALRHDFMNGGRRGAHSIDPASIVALQAKLPGLKYAHAEATAFLSEKRDELERGKKVCTDWEKSHAPLLALEEMLKSYSAAGQFVPFQRELDKEEREARFAEEQRHRAAAAKYVEAALLK